MAKRISIINFKGGVGKTTLAFHLGTGLSWLHDAKVLLVDMDHQSSLSVLCMGYNAYDEAIERGHMINEVFLTFTGERRHMPGHGIINRAPMREIDSDYNNMDIIPASLELDDIEIELTASRQGAAVRSEWNQRTLICRWIEENMIDEKYDYIIFDCPPATKIVSQNAIAASHGYIVPVVPESVMIRGVPHLIRLIQTGIDQRLKNLAGLDQVQFGVEPRSIYVPDSELVGLVVTRIQTGAGGNIVSTSRDILTALENRWGKYLIEPFIQQGTGVNDALFKGIPVYNDWKNPNVSEIVSPHNESYIDLTYSIKAELDKL